MRLLSRAAASTRPGSDLRLENSTVSENSAAASGGDGGGLFATESELTIGNPLGSVAIAFTTFRGNTAGNGSTDGDAIFADFPNNPITVRASIIDEGADGCKISADTDIESGGYNVEDVIDADCGIDAVTDSHDSDFLNALTNNGSPPVGAPTNEPSVPGIYPLTNAFTNNVSGALDIVPPPNA